MDSNLLFRFRVVWFVLFFETSVVGVVDGVVGGVVDGVVDGFVACSTCVGLFVSFILVEVFMISSWCVTSGEKWLVSYEARDWKMLLCVTNLDSGILNSRTAIGLKPKSGLNGI